MELKKIGSFIFKLRKEMGLTQAELAEKIGVSDKTVSKWENGNCLPDSTRLGTVAEILNVTVFELMNGERNIDTTTNNINKTISSGVNYYHEKEKKKFNKKLLVILVLVVILIIALLSIFFFNNYDNCKIFSILSDSREYSAKGNIIITNEGTTITLLDVSLSGNDSTNYYAYEYELYLGKERLYKNGNIALYEHDSSSELLYLNDAIENISIYVKNNNDLNDINGNLKLVINYLDKKLETQTINMDLSLVKDFSNNKLLYQKDKQ